MKQIIINNQIGQSTIEFILSISFVLVLFLMFITTGINYVLGYVVHYTNFMSSRTFLVADNNSKEVGSAINYARSQAIEAFTRYQLNRVGLGNDILKLNTPDTISRKVYVGTYAYFQRPFNLYFGSESEGMTNFLSESFLGKEPLRTDCYEQTCQAMGISNCSSGLDVTLFDNGC